MKGNVANGTVAQLDREMPKFKQMLKLSEQSGKAQRHNVKKLSVKSGVPGAIRTLDPLLRRQPLYPLSYRDIQNRQFKFTIGRDDSQGEPAAALGLPHAVNGESELGQAGDDNAGNQYAGKDRNKGMPEFQPEKHRRQ